MGPKGYGNATEITGEDRCNKTSIYFSSLLIVKYILGLDNPESLFFWAGIMNSMFVCLFCFFFFFPPCASAMVYVSLGNNTY